jgi:hypothetical protein
MFSIKSFFIAAISLSAFIFSAYSAEQKPAGTASNTTYDSWVPIDEVDWAVYMDAPSYHFNLAKEYLQKGDFSKASSELKRGNSFLIFERNRLSAVSKQIEELSKSITTTREKDSSKLDAVTSNALKVINHKYAMVPVEIDATRVFEDAYQYHFDKAKLKLQENDHSGAAFEIRRAASFMRLKAAHAGHIVRADLDSAGNDLKELASKVESGAVKDIKELDQVFQKALHVFSKEKQKS